ncbi:hypothetical protein RUM44_004707 [Polyplax serrata]|uniref:Uncharacterized protein n=1 Tax=Polyplax serrata TaxID=468196 RepID=A0ABR1B3L1_POLSC
MSNFTFRTNSAGRVLIIKRCLCQQLRNPNVKASKVGFVLKRTEFFTVPCVCIVKEVFRGTPSARAGTSGATRSAYTCCLRNRVLNENERIRGEFRNVHWNTQREGKKNREVTTVRDHPEDVPLPILNKLEKEFCVCDENIARERTESGSYSTLPGSF